MSHSFDFCASARQVLLIEQQTIADLQAYIGQSFSDICQTLLGCEGKVIVTGMGKSGHIGRKMAATFASTGTPSFYVHPGEASHGDLGMIDKKDIVIALSNSGSSSEILAMIPVLKRLGITLICITGNENSAMAKEANHHLCIKVEKEACPLGLAPTSSTTAALVMGDALAVALLEAKGFTANDFALSHPGGALGKQLLLRVDDLMHSQDETPIVGIDQTISKALMEVTHKGLGMTAVVDKCGDMVGIFTDGDLRRVLDSKIDIHTTEIGEVMTSPCMTIEPGILAAEALLIMQERKINGLIVVVDNKPIAALNMHDLLRAGVF